MAQFDDVGDKFIAYYHTVRGYVREQLIQQNLRGYFGSKRLEIIDVGGGDGRDAAWLAGLHHKVTLVDPSGKMIRLAKKRFLDQGLQVTALQIRPELMGSYFDKQKFGMVLSHGVLLYCLDEPETHIKNIASLVKTGGMVSLATKGYGGALVRALQAKDHQAVTGILHRQKSINNLGVSVWAFKPEQVEKMLRKYRLKVVSWRGVRIGSDYDTRELSKVSKSDLHQILASETQLGASSSTKGTGQMLHFIAQKI